MRCLRSKRLVPKLTYPTLTSSRARDPGSFLVFNDPSAESDIRIERTEYTLHNKKAHPTTEATVLRNNLEDTITGGRGGLIRRLCSLTSLDVSDTGSRLTIFGKCSYVFKESVATTYTPLCGGTSIRRKPAVLGSCVD